MDLVQQRVQKVKERSLVLVPFIFTGKSRKVKRLAQSHTVSGGAEIDTQQSDSEAHAAGAQLFRVKTKGRGCWALTPGGPLETQEDSLQAPGNTGVSTFSYYFEYNLPRTLPALPRKRNLWEIG